MSFINLIRKNISVIWQVVALLLILQGVTLTTPSVPTRPASALTNIEDAAPGELLYHSFPAALV